MGERKYQDAISLEHGLGGGGMLSSGGAWLDGLLSPPLMEAALSEELEEESSTSMMSLSLAIVLHEVCFLSLGTLVVGGWQLVMAGHWWLVAGSW